MRRPTLGFIFITLLLDILGFSLLIPVGPALIAKVQGYGSLHGSESQTAPAVGMLNATFAVMLFIFAPILGSVSDRVGRRPVILFSLVGSGIDYVAMALAPNLAVLFVTRAINGLTGANITACSAYIADVTPPEKRSAGYGIVGAAFGLGFIIGPLLGGLLGDPEVKLPLLGQGDIRYPFIGAAILAFVNFLYGLFVLPESLAREHRRAFSWARANPVGTLMWVRGRSLVATLTAGIFLVNLAQYGLHSTWVLSMSARFGWGPEEVGFSLFAVGLLAAIVQGGFARRVIPKVGERACVAGGLVLAVIAYLFYGLAPASWVVYVGIVLGAIGGLAMPAAQGILSKAVPVSEQGLLQGALSGLNSIALALGHLFGTFVFRFFTSAAAPLHLPQNGAGAPFLASALLAALALLPVAVVWGRLPRTVEEASPA
jgi:DHA1 family tetracycline resistance protein-like MFS transporter